LELVRLHCELGLVAELVPLTGATRGKRDRDVYCFAPETAPLVCEVEARTTGQGFATLGRWLGDADADLRRDRALLLVVFPAVQGQGR
jgi:hypothetical protein